MYSIYFDFLGELEGCELTGYVPDVGNSQSGVTIASGFDLGFRHAKEISGAFSKPLADMLAPYCGFKGTEAVTALEANPLVITNGDAAEINEFAYSQALDRLVDAWDKSDASVAFDTLPPKCQTVIASVAFQYGDLASRTPNFWRQVTSCDWSSALTNLRDFKDRYPTRRNQEADLLSQYLDKQQKGEAA